ncbi:hypothetical protein DVA67_022870 [Solirubrobacter sp. CPCC 204708]|uniref:Peptidase S55 domain-containing protein n=1 Tax=Solirubrobacter deserti TaxID=2282478 RepID=A0ABT4RI45_9ACTN|nr:hypothetical protein [Solirubrobacter deserti]MBE2318837.1 hypothetical protein [Solirubrobacter deserti]MDA0138217.1 hypothetical protein [Solirubrobacter deserti]
MRLLGVAAAVAAFLVPAAPAFAGDPTMPLWQVHGGMRCTGYSVIQGTTISSFDVLVQDVAAGEASGGGRILVEVSGPAVDATGIGPGFSGSPIYCPDAAGTNRVIGAISESINEYGGKAALATPIEAILGTPVDVPGRTNAASSRASTKGTSARMKAALASAKPIAAPMSVSGLTGTVADALVKASAKAGRPVLAVPPGPLGFFPPQTLQPGSAVAVGYSTGDVRTSSVGTVTYVDGDRVWVFGHQLEGVGRRALILQDAYVFRIVNNPNALGQIGSTYKLASSGHDLGTISSDGLSAVAGRTGALPHTVPVQVIARDQDTNGLLAVNAAAADEAAVDLPSGGSWTSFVAPLSVSQAAAGLLGSVPSRLTGEMCARITIQQIGKPVRFCNRYVSVSAAQADDGTTLNAVLSGASNDLATAISAIDAYTGTPPNVTGVNVLMKVRRGADQAFIRSVKLPARVRPGQRVRVRVSLQRVRGGTLTRSYTMRIPSDAARGTQRLRFVGQDADQGEDGFTTIIIGDEDERDEGGDPGPRSLRELEAQIKAIGRFDGVTVRAGRGSRVEAFRDDEFRISGTADASTRVVR